MSIRESTFTLKASYLEIYNEKVCDIIISVTLYKILILILILILIMLKKRQSWLKNVVRLKQSMLFIHVLTVRLPCVNSVNFQVQDLLELSSSHDSLGVRWSADRGFYMEDLFCVKCESEDDLMAVLEEGMVGCQFIEYYFYVNFHWLLPMIYY